jgi:Ferredoxin-like domain in Api92-like protein
MPNYCSCDLIIKGDENTIKRINQDIIYNDPNEPYFDFNLIKPMPDDLRSVTSGGNEYLYRILFQNEQPFHPRTIEFEEQVRLEKLVKAKFPTVNNTNISNFVRSCYDIKKDMEAVEQYKNNYDKYGHTSWYSWAIENWGTKWRGSDFSLKKEKCNEKQIFCTFDTAWSPPLPVIQKFALMYVSATITLKYFECGAAFKGMVKYKNGALVKQDQSDYRGKRGG